MYFIDFFKSLLKSHRIPVILYLAINVLIITHVVNFYITGGTEYFYWPSLLISLVIYLISIMIALSPIGEWILRFQAGCIRIKRVDYSEKFQACFSEVYAKAKKANPNLPDNIELFVNNDTSKNAFATGRRTICVTKGMLDVPEDEIKGVLGHEFAHIANHDTDLILVVVVGNMIITAMILIVRWTFRLMSIFGSTMNIFNRGSGNTTILAGALGDAVIAIMMWAWTKLGQYLVLATGRAEEFYADEFSFRLGYSEGMCRFLDKYANGGKSKGVFAVLSSSHPTTDDRIARLQQLGCTYRSI